MLPDPEWTSTGEYIGTPERADQSMRTAAMPSIDDLDRDARREIAWTWAGVVALCLSLGVMIGMVVGVKLMSDGPQQAIAQETTHAE